jgi:hypothetical protein
VLGAAAAYGWDTTMNHSFVLGFVIPFGWTNKFVSQEENWAMNWHNPITTTYIRKQNIRM